MNSLVRSTIFLIMMFDLIKLGQLRTRKSCMTSVELAPGYPETQGSVTTTLIPVLGQPELLRRSPAARSR